MRRSRRNTGALPRKRPSLFVSILPLRRGRGVSAGLEGSSRRLALWGVQLLQKNIPRILLHALGGGRVDDSNHAKRNRNTKRRTTEVERRSEKVRHSFQSARRSTSICSMHPSRCAFLPIRNDGSATTTKRMTTAAGYHQTRREPFHSYSFGKSDRQRKRDPIGFANELFFFFFYERKCVYKDYWTTTSTDAIFNTPSPFLKFSEGTKRNRNNNHLHKQNNTKKRKKEVFEVSYVGRVKKKERKTQRRSSTIFFFFSKRKTTKKYVVVCTQTNTDVCYLKWNIGASYSSIVTLHVPYTCFRNKG